MFEDDRLLSAPADIIDRKSQQIISRRDVLTHGLVGLLALTTPLLPSRNSWAASRYSNWRVNLRHAHTGEEFSGVYRVGDRYLPEAFYKLNTLLRDFRVNEKFPMDPRVIDIVSIIQRKTRRSCDVLSGYRCPKTNASLREASTGVARNSFHMYGQAMDIRIEDYSTRRLRDVAKSLRAGGVGYYPRSDFVHVDTGQVRSW